MTHAGLSKSFFGMFKETSIAYFFDLGGLFAGFMVASQLGVFRLSPWAIALYPAIISAEGVIEGLLSGRLSTALHLGTVYPRFFMNTKSFYKLIEAVTVLTLATSAAMSTISLVFGHLFWGITFADFSAILSVVVATMAMGLVLLLVTIKVAFASFKRGLDPDVVVYPVMSVVATIFITFCFIVTLNLLLFFNYLGRYIVIILGMSHLVLVLYVFPRNIREPEFTKTIWESLAALMLVAFIVNITGTILKGISNFVRDRKEIYTVYPALIGLVGDVGSVVGSTATTKFALGLLRPSLSSMRNHAKNILSAWAASIAMFVVLAVSGLSIHGLFSLSAFSSLISILLVANVIAVAMIVLLSYAVSILTFQKGLDPGNFVIPIESSFAASVTSIALLMALLLVR
jgi:mgtE-like transporter